MGRARARPVSAASRPILTCEQCRSLKLRCDKRKPRCSRCRSSGQACNYLSQQAKEVSSARSLARRIKLPVAGSGPGGSNDSESRSHAKAGKSSVSIQSFDGVQSHNQDESCQSLRSDSEDKDSGGDSGPDVQSKSLPAKRSRAVLSCSRCRKLKVKCDRRSPCSRCLKYGRTCKYLPVWSAGNTVGARESEPSTPSNDLQKARRLWEAKHSTESHWYSLIAYGSGLLQENGLSHFEKDPYRHPVTGNWASPNYPFVPCSDKVVLSKIMPSQETTKLLVQRYFDTMGQIFRIIDRVAFEVELESFWGEPEEASPGWTAQLFLMMSLGCDSLKMEDGDFAASNEHLPNVLLEQATALLHQTPFMFRPDLCTIRSLCLTVMAKQMFNKSCLEEDASWCITGIIKRLAMSINLHIEHPTGDAPTELDSGLRRRLWTAILYLDLRQSVLSGLPLLLEPVQISFVGSTSLGLYQPFPGSSTPQTTGGKTYEEAFQSVFHRALPLAHETILAARSVDCDYETAIRIDKEVRDIFRELKQIPHEEVSLGAGQLNKSFIWQWEIIYLDNMFRRLLLELHRRFAYEPQASVYYPVSHWSTLDCAAAMLVLQQSIFCENPGFAGGKWLGGMFRSDFWVAGLTVSVYLIQDKALLDSPTLLGGYARNTLLDALRSCRDMSVESKDTWVCELRKFQFFDQVINALDQGVVGESF